MSITPINKSTEEYKELLEILREHQTLPVLLAALNAGLRLNADLKRISDLLSEIFICDEDQFWGEKIKSQYFKKHRKTLNHIGISKYRFSEASFLEFFKFVGEIIAEYDLNHIEGFNLFNSSKDAELIEQYIATNEPPKNLDVVNTNSSIPYDTNRPSSQVLEPEVGELLTEFVQSKVEEEHNARTTVKKNYKASGMRILHFLNYFKESNFYNQNSEPLRKFDTYLSSFFQPHENPDTASTKNEIKNKKKIISKENGEELLKILASVSFSRLLTQCKIKFSGVTVTQIINERLESSLIQNIGKNSEYNVEYLINSEQNVQYLIILAHLKILAPLLEVSIIENKIVSVQECGNEMFDFLQNKEDIPYVFLASSYFAILIDHVVLEDYGYFFNSSIMKGISKGVPHSSNYTEEIEVGLAELFDKDIIDKGFEKILNKTLYKNLINWTLPLCDIDRFSVHCDYTGFLEDNINQQTITDALKEVEKAEVQEPCLFPDEFLDKGSYAVPDESIFDWEEETHPALHSTTFARNVIVLDPNKYILFGKSLMIHGQPYYACLITAVFFHLRLYVEMVYEKKENEIKTQLPKLNSQDFSNWLKDLQGYKQYSLVESSIKAYLEEGELSDENFGFLSAFIDQKNDEIEQKSEKEKVVELQVVSSNATSEKLTRFCPAARSSFKKCMDLLANESLIQIGLGNYLPITAGNAIEAELKARTTDVDQVSLEEIKRETGLRPSPNAKDTSKFQLGNFVFLLENFSELSALSKSKMVSLNRMYKDKDFQIFVEAVKNISEARNAVAHVSNFMKAEDVGRTIAVVEELKPNINVCISMLEKTTL